jgi:hypothetical protein
MIISPSFCVPPHALRKRDYILIGRPYSPRVFLAAMSFVIDLPPDDDPDDEDYCERDEENDDVVDHDDEGDDFAEWI